jgi:serine/threonine-protein kinase RsbT
MMNEKAQHFYIRNEADLTSTLMKSRRALETWHVEGREKGLILTSLSELAMNIIKYACHGEIMLSLGGSSPRRFVIIEACDRGPGIADSEQALQEHFSTGKTLGLGLPGVKRMMDEFQLSSQPRQGTTVKVKKWL